MRYSFGQISLRTMSKPLSRSAQKRCACSTPRRAAVAGVEAWVVRPKTSGDNSTTAEVVAQAPRRDSSRTAYRARVALRSVIARRG